METTIVHLPFQHLLGQFLFIFHFGNKNLNFPEIPTIEVGEKKIAPHHQVLGYVVNSNAKQFFRIFSIMSY